MEQLPLMEKSLTDVLAKVSKQKVNGRNVQDLIKLYCNLMSTYNNSLDLLRKILVYFPPEGVYEDKELLANFSSLSTTDRALVKKFVTQLQDGTETKSSPTS